MNYGPRGNDLGNSLGSGGLERASMNRARRARASVRQPSMKRGAAISAGLHVAALLALLVVIPPNAPPPPPPEEDTVAVEFEGHSAHAQKAEKTGKVAAPTDNEADVTDNPAIKPPEKAPIETAPPPPPPPPPPPMAEPEIKPPDVKVVEPPKPAETPAPVKPPPPKQQVKPPPTPPPPPKLKSVRSQPNPTKNAVPDTRALDNTLEKFMADQTQKAPPTHRYNPERGGKKNGGGSKSGFLTGELSDGQRKQIGDDVRRCYSEDTEARDYAKYMVVMTVTIDATGEARQVKLSDADQSHANADPAFRAFAERAERAVLDPTCAKLPVPPDLLGKPAQDLMFRFRP
jgi:outer membrane biosynthesis protein TonB